MNAGLVPSVALAGLAAIRTDTHRVLSALNASLDAGYLAQRFMIKDQAEAIDQLLGLVASELRSVMEDRIIGKHAEPEAIRAWLHDQLDREVPLGIASSANPTEVLNVLLKFGLFPEDIAARGTVGTALAGLNMNTKKLKLNKSASLFTDEEQLGEQSNLHLAMRLTLKNHYQKYPRFLQLGTLVRCDGVYYLCLQPLCDSVRLTEERGFLFLPADELPETGTVIVRDPEDPKSLHRLEVQTEPYALEKFCFAPANARGRVQATEHNGTFAFRDTNQREYVWVASLNDSKAQAFAHTLGKLLSRIGESESEWLRPKLMTYLSSLTAVSSG
jgi:hypothetical protein